jgi:hypothetical protein
MDEKTFEPSKRRVYFSIGPLAVIANYTDTSQETLEELSLINLSPTAVVINGFGLEIDGEHFGSHIFDLIEPYKEAACINASLYEAWSKSLSAYVQDTLYLRFRSNDGSIEGKLRIKGFSDNEFTLEWPVRISRREGQPDRVLFAREVSDDGSPEWE